MNPPGDLRTTVIAFAVLKAIALAVFIAYIVFRE